MQGADRRRCPERRSGAGARCGAGVERVVIGTAAVEHPELVDELCREPSRAASRSGSTRAGSEVAIRGWVEGTGPDLVDLVRRFDGSAIGALVVT